MVDQRPESHHTVNDVMRRWPETEWLFMHYGMACAGCPVGALHTVEDAALEYRIPLKTFLCELRAAVTDGYKRSTAKPKPHRAKARQGARPKCSRRTPIRRPARHV